MEVSSCPAFAYPKDSSSMAKSGKASPEIVVEPKIAEVVLASRSLRGPTTVAMKDN